MSDPADLRDQAHEVGRLLAQGRVEEAIGAWAVGSRSGGLRFLRAMFEEISSVFRWYAEQLRAYEKRSWSLVTDKQLSFIEALGGTPDPEMTKDEASHLIWRLKVCQEAGLEPDADLAALGLPLPRRCVADTRPRCWSFAMSWTERAVCGPHGTEEERKQNREANRAWLEQLRGQVPDWVHPEDAYRAGYESQGRTVPRKCEHTTKAGQPCGQYALVNFRIPVCHHHVTPDDYLRHDLEQVESDLRSGYLRDETEAQRARDAALDRYNQAVAVLDPYGGMSPL